ncbi:hypothetical protein [Leptolyngbya sp. FACHB-711]|uniref:calcium-binding protein n=1 Tax=unclassified Leptolyngbya TaxID=2650499 RepID=UPI001682BCF4|nr:hypothetical protein [Leptolyngbya sp. FACHB-711]MBD2024600.1 hypothetical protein [Leptolyngbya sp. FACHB-711]
MARDNDNSLGNARDLGVFPLSGRIVSDTVSSTDDLSDFYRINVSKPIRLGATLIPKNSDVDLFLRSADGQAISSSRNRGTAVDSLNAETIAPGVYFLEVQKPDSGSTAYDLSLNGLAVSEANLSVNVKAIRALERFDPRTIFGNFQQADFQIFTNIQGESRKSKVFGNNDQISPNFIVSKSVDLNQRFVPVNLAVTDHDPAPSRFDDFADFNPSNTQIGSSFEFDAATGRLRSQFGNNSGGFGVPRLEGEVITLEGDGKGAPVGQGGTKRAVVSFQVTYDAFTNSFATFSNSTPIIRGTNASQDLTGKNQGGILCGEGGNDTLSGMGGNDALCGGTGNDTQIGGTGNDMSFGGAGNDTHMGGSGKDTFVLALNNGVDVVKDFQKGKDKLGLAIELNPEILDIVQQGKNVVVGVGDQRLAVLSNVKANQITAADFVTVDFTHFKGMEVPTLVA